MGMIRTLFLDFYGTLADIHTDESRDAAFHALGRCCERCGAHWTPEALRTFYRMQHEAVLAAARRLPGWAEPDFSEVFAPLLTEKGAEATPQAVAALAWEFRQGSTEYLRLYPGAADFLRGARRAGYRCVLVSNAQSLFTRPELERLRLLPLLDAVCISSEAGVKKPDERFYRYALEKTGAMPGQTLMIGNDALCDIAGGHNAGLHTAYFHTPLSPGEDPAAPPEADAAFEGADYTGLAAALGI